MRYTIGAAAKILGISSELLRHYERVGIISPQRSVNGYRYYDLDTIKKLTGVRRWRSMGFQLEDITRLLSSGSHQETVALYQARIAEIEQEICWQQQVKEAVTLLTQEVEAAVEAVGEVSLREMPDMLQLLYQHDYEFRMFDRRQCRGWMDRMPVVSISPAFSLEEILQGGDGHAFGYVIPLEKARRWQLEQTEHAQVIKGGLHASTVIYSEGSAHIRAGQLTFMLPVLAQQGFKPAGDAWGMTLCSFKEGKTCKKYHRMFLPVEAVGNDGI